MPPIIPPNENLLNAPSSEDSTGQAASTPVGETIPVAISPRRLTIFYQNGNEVPAKPVLGQEVDIANSIVDRYAEYTAERSSVNNIPVVGLPVQKVGFKNVEEQNQVKYINTNNFPSDAKNEFNSKPTQFAVEIVTPDPVGVNYKNDNAEGPRNFSINTYQKTYIKIGRAHV